MRIVKSMRISTAIVLCFALCFALSSCDEHIQIKWMENYGNNPLQNIPIEYDLVSFDIRELNMQIPEYMEYRSRYDEYKQKLVKNFRTDARAGIKGFLSEPGEYVGGVDIAVGIYLILSEECDENGVSSKGVRVYPPKAERTTSSVNSSRNDELLGFYLNEGGTLKIEAGYAISAEDYFAVDRTAGYVAHGIYYGTCYRAGKDIPFGDYFVVSTDFISSTSYVQQFGDGFERKSNFLRFGYAKISEDVKQVLLSHCFLIPIKQKPEIGPAWSWDYETMVWPTGEYVVGEELPLGKYIFKRDVYCKVDDPDSTETHYENVHQDDSYERTISVRCLLMVRDTEDAHRIGWSEYEVDPTYEYVNFRPDPVYVRIVSPDGEVRYVEHNKNEDVTVEFTEADRGCIITIVRAVLIPEV